jgi:hypothetical protein
MRTQIGCPICKRGSDLSTWKIWAGTVKVSFLRFYRSEIHFLAVEMLLETYFQQRTIQANILRMETGEKVNFVRLRRRASSTSSVPQRSLPNRQTKSAIDRPDTRDLTVVVDTLHLSLPATVTQDMLLPKPRGGKTIPYERSQSSLRKPQTFGGR